MTKADRAFWLLWAAIMFVALSVVASAQTPKPKPQPDWRGEYRIGPPPTIDGEPVNAPVPPEMHTRNHNPNLPMWGGCVPSSVRTAALYHGVPRDKVDAFWHLAQRRVGIGGTNPQMLEAMLKETMPGVKYYSHVGNDPRILEQLSKRKVVICSTMGWGQGYPGLINHWVNVLHYKTGGKAMIVDNNDVGFYHIMPASEFARRSTKDGREPLWVFCFTELYRAIAAQLRWIVPAVLVFVGLGPLLIGFAVFVSRRLAEPPPEGYPCSA